jgi:LPS O-antigen subunit length determinant protein (WzzB/FepE family)
LNIADQNPPQANDEIDLKELFLHLWAGKLYIISSIFICILLASLHLNIAERKYDVVYNLAPVSTTDARPNLGGLGGLASLAGVPLPSSSSSDFLTFRFLLLSEEVAEILLQNSNLMQSIFKSEWNIREQKFQRPDVSLPTSLLSPIKRLLTGNETRGYIAPNAPRLLEWMQDNLLVSEDKETGFLVLKSTTSQPELMIHLMQMTAKTTDDLMKNRFIIRSENTASFYNKQLSKARAREHREALATLLAEEDQKLILALRGQHFIAEPVTIPSVSLYPTSPKSSLVLALSIVLGGFLGSAFVLVRRAIRK